MSQTKEIKRVNGYRIGQEVVHDGQSGKITSFPNRRSAVVSYTSENRKWASALVPIKELARA